MIQEILVIAFLVSFWSFLARETDFIYEYINLLPKSKLPDKLVFYMKMYANADADMGDTFFKFSMNQISFDEENSKFLKFISHLLSCHICTNTFFSVLFGAMAANPLFLLAPIPAVILGFFLKFLRNKIE